MAMIHVSRAVHGNVTDAILTEGNVVRTQMRLALFQNINFSGRRIVFRNGSVAVRDIRAFEFNDQLSSFRVRGGNVTLVLFADINYQGRFLVFRGNQNISDLRQFNFNDQMSSFIFVRGNVSNAQIARLQASGRVPQGVLEIFM